MDDKIAALKNIIEEKVFVQNKDEQIFLHEDPEAWLFDFRRVLMNGKNADLISDIFYEQLKDEYPFQLSTIEIAGVPLMMSLMHKFYQNGHTDINAFFIRKSRKKTALMRMIEGEIQSEKKIILVDDIMNRGNSFWRQVEVLDSLGYTINTVWSILRYRDLPYYKRFTDRGITVKSLFTLNDFTKALGPRVKNFELWDRTPPSMPFEAKWIFKSPRPSYNYVVQKSQPVLDDEKIYFGSDNRTFWAINQNEGSVAWQFAVGPHVNKKSIFSSPVLYKDLVIFGSYDGNVYALERKTGEKRWVSFEADWVGSSPAVAKDLGLVFVGLEFGLFRRHGGIVALNANTGETVWIDDTHPAYTHSSPCYIEGHQQVAIGSNDGRVRLYNAQSGIKLWEFATEGGKVFDHESNAGFGKGDIKESFAYDPKRDYLVFGSIDGSLYILRRKTGEFAHRYECLFGIHSTPLIYRGRVYFTSVDKHLYCIDLDTFALVFKKNLDGTRIFSSPVIINGKLYVGTNAARLHELSPETGEQLGYFQARERITNSVVYDKENDTYYLPTYANEIICLKRRPQAEAESIKL